MMSSVTDDELLPIDHQIASFKRAIEAVVLVAHDPVAPELLAQLLEQPVASVEQWATRKLEFPLFKPLLRSGSGFLRCLGYCAVWRP